MANLKIAWRLGLGFILVFVLLIGLLVVDSWKMEQLNNELNNVYKLNSNKINLAHNMYGEIKTIDSLMRDVLLGEYQDEKLNSVNAIETARSKYKIYFNELKELVGENKEELALLSLIDNNLEKAADYNDQVTKLGLTGDTEQATLLLNAQSKPLMIKILDQLEILVGVEEKNTQEQYANQAKMFDETRNAILGIAGVIVLIGIVIAFVFARSISNPVAKLARAADLASSGDLTVEIPVKSRDEIGLLAESFRKMVGQMRALVSQITEKAHTVAGAAGQLTASAQQTAAGANESTAAMSQISSTVERVSAIMNQINTASDSASGFAAKGSEGITRFTGQMQIISGSAGEAASVINGFSLKSQEIGQIVELITGIADQTNLLALNAAIEAARAGEMGRGFAVVAEEVRKLAEQSSGAAKEIYDLVNSIQLESQKAVEIMEQGGKNVTEGNAVVHEVGQNFKEIISAVQGLNEQIREVASAAGQMTSGIQVAVASTEEQTASMEEVSASAESLNNLAVDLTNLVERFKV